MRSWQSVSQGLRLMRAGTILSMVGTTVMVLLSGSLLGHWLGWSYHLITIGFFVSLAGTARAVSGAPSQMGSAKKLLALGGCAELSSYLLAKFGPQYYYGQSWFSLGSLCYRLEELLGLLAFAGLMLGLTALSAQVKRSDLASGFLGLVAVAVASSMGWWMVGHLSISFLWNNLWAILGCMFGYWFVFTLLVKKLALAVDAQNES